MVERADQPQLASFFSHELPVEGETIVLGGDEAHHVRVRRLEVGARIRLLDGAGTVGDGVLLRVAKGSAAVEIESVRIVAPMSPLHVIVPVADRDRMLWLAEKAVELGATTWRPVIWKRSRSVSPRGEGATFQGKVRARMIAALTQSGNAWLPTLYPDAPIDRAIAAAPPGARLLLDQDGEPIGSMSLSAPVTLAVGPEGGIEPRERDAFVEGGFVVASLPGNVLRFETAGVAGIAVARARMAGDNREVGSDV
jgi:16S rRNA (uracil1498-N3)-methyltransferase